MAVDSGHGRRRDDHAGSPDVARSARSICRFHTPCGKPRKPLRPLTVRWGLQHARNTPIVAEPIAKPQVTPFFHRAAGA